MDRNSLFRSLIVTRCPPEWRWSEASLPSVSTTEVIGFSYLATWRTFLLVYLDAELLHLIEASLRVR